MREDLLLAFLILTSKIFLFEDEKLFRVFFVFRSSRRGEDEKSRKKIFVSYSQLETIFIQSLNIFPDS